MKNKTTTVLFISPYLAHFALFVGFPVLFSIVLVFHKWDIISPMQWAGLAHFQKLAQDRLFWQALLNTGVFLVLHIPLQLIVALFLAVQLNSRIRLRAVWRAIFFMPVIVSGVVVSILWDKLYAQDTGIINKLLAVVGIDSIGWLVDPLFAMPSIALMATWKNVGLYIVLFLVGLQSVPKQLYEAADIDGANGWQKFYHITLPIINPTVILVLILSTIGGFSLFIEPYIMTGGGPMNKTLSALLYIYKQAFFFYHMGYAATLGLAFALLVMTVVFIQRRIVESRE